MKDYIIGGLIILGTIVPLACFKYFLRREPLKEVKVDNQNIIKQPAMYMWVGIIGIIVFLSLILLTVLSHVRLIQFATEDSIYALPLFLPFILTGVYIILLGSVWKIEIYEDSFMHCNSFGKKKTYKFSDIELVHKSASVRVHYNGKKVINISYLQSNFDALQKALSNYNKKKKESKKRKAKEK